MELNYFQKNCALFLLNLSNRKNLSGIVYSIKIQEVIICLTNQVAVKADVVPEDVVAAKLNIDMSISISNDALVIVSLIVFGMKNSISRNE